jgi:putative peptidoglycan lipid II flippase
VTLTGALGLVFALVLPGLLGLDARWGVAGLTASAGLAGWVEYALLRRAAAARIGRLAPDGAHLPRLWLCAAAAGLTGWGARLTTEGLPPLVHAGIVLGVFGATYLGVTHRAGLSESAALWRRLRRR